MRRLLPLTALVAAGFSLNLEAGEYTFRCNGGSEEDGTLTVSGKAPSTSSPEVEAAIQIANGANELLSEVSATKITG
jgi:hypothetical protein